MENDFPHFLRDLWFMCEVYFQPDTKMNLMLSFAEQECYSVALSANRTNKSRKGEPEASSEQRIPIENIICNYPNRHYDKNYFSLHQQD